MSAVRKAIRPEEFFSQNPVFRHEEFKAFHVGRSEATTRAVLQQHVKAGNLLHLRRGLYATVPRGADAEGFHPDPFLVTSRLTNDAVIAYHAALQFHGKSYSIWQRFHSLTSGRGKLFIYRGAQFVPVQAPASLRRLEDFGGGIIESRHAGSSVRVTSLERTLVDVLDDPAKCGGWEEVWRSLDSIEFFDLNGVIEYVRKLDKAFTAAKVGYYIAENRERLFAEEKHLDQFAELIPSQPAYLDAKLGPGKLVKRWNLIVPETILKRSWEEFS